MKKNTVASQAFFKDRGRSMASKFIYCYERHLSFFLFFVAFRLLHTYCIVGPMVLPLMMDHFARVRVQRTGSLWSQCPKGEHQKEWALHHLNTIYLEGKKCFGATQCCMLPAVYSYSLWCSYEYTRLMVM